MPIIKKAKETMTSKQRIQKTFNFEKTDRVPVTYFANRGIHAKLCAELGVQPDDRESLNQAIGVDDRAIAPPYTGPKLFDDIKDRYVDPLIGYVARWIEHESGSYLDYCDFPLQGADDETFDAFPVPDPDDFDYDQALARAKSYDNKYGLYVGDTVTGDVINSSGLIMGVEDILCHLMLENEAPLRLIKRRTDYHFGKMERLLDKCKGHIDFMFLAEDLGTQHTPMISLELYRKLIKPVHKRFADLANAYNIPTMFHSCGSSSWVYEDWIEIGIKGVDSIQPEAVNMSPEYLVKHFGGRLNFRSLISSAGPLAYGTAEETRDICIKTLDIMMTARGYHFAPSCSIQDNSPVENVIAMYQTAHSFGIY